MDLSDQVAALRAAPLFRDLDDSRLKVLAYLVEQVSFAKDEVLFDAGETIHEVLIITGGEVEIAVHGSSLFEVVDRYGPGQAIGMIGVLSELPSPASAKALEETEALALPAGDLRSFLKSNADFSFAVACLLARRVSERTAALLQSTGTHPDRSG